jgi:mono/diheme cytochrome c family protein
MRAPHALPLAAAVLPPLQRQAALVYSAPTTLGPVGSIPASFTNAGTGHAIASKQLRAPTSRHHRWTIRIARGAGIYRDNCVQCHGAPGVAPGDIGKSYAVLAY